MAAVLKFSRLYTGNLCNTCKHISALQQRENSNRAAITRTLRQHYIRTYPVRLVQQDGSTITIRYEKPRKLLKMPIDLSVMTEQEKKARIQRLAPPKKMKVQEEIEDNFDAKSYLRKIKK